VTAKRGQILMAQPPEVSPLEPAQVFLARRRSMRFQQTQHLANVVFFPGLQGDLHLGGV
jgi:hypothetical protein